MANTSIIVAFARISGTIGFVNEAVEDVEQPKPQFTKKQIDRISQPAMAMLLTMLVTVAIVLPLMLINPMSKKNEYDPQIDVTQLAAEGSTATPIRLAAPQVPQEWNATFARWKRDAAAQVDYWEVGYVTNGKEFAGLTQAVGANPSWVTEKTQKATGDQTVNAAGYSWQVRTAEDNTYWLLDTAGTDLPGTEDGQPQTVILTSSGTAEELTKLADATVAELKKTD